MTTKIIVNGSYGSHEFDHQDPLSTLTALRAEADDRVKAAKDRLERAENSVIAAKVDVEFHVEIRQRYDNALEALQSQEIAA